jgi:hypothetical protein
LAVVGRRTLSHLICLPQKRQVRRRQYNFTSLGKMLRILLFLAVVV